MRLTGFPATLTPVSWLLKRNIHFPSTFAASSLRKMTFYWILIRQPEIVSIQRCRLLTIAIPIIRIITLNTILFFAILYMERRSWYRNERLVMSSQLAITCGREQSAFHDLCLVGKSPAHESVKLAHRKLITDHKGLILPARWLRTSS